MRGNVWKMRFYKSYCCWWQCFFVPFNPSIIWGISPIQIPTASFPIWPEVPDPLSVSVSPPAKPLMQGKKVQLYQEEKSIQYNWGDYLIPRVKNSLPQAWPVTTAPNTPWDPGVFEVIYVCFEFTCWILIPVAFPCCIWEVSLQNDRQIETKETMILPHI